jgi:hypothetical protein
MKIDTVNPESVVNRAGWLARGGLQRGSQDPGRLQGHAPFTSTRRRSTQTKNRTINGFDSLKEA